LNDFFRLTAVEELAGMDILCSDKTGTLTQNKLSVAESLSYEGFSHDEVVFFAALASKPENDDAIDIAIVESCSAEQLVDRKKHEILSFHPFDPVIKKSFAKVKSPSGRVFHAAKVSLS
jgi:H+-transporting ATPase